MVAAEHVVLGELPDRRSWRRRGRGRRRCRSRGTPRRTTSRGRSMPADLLMSRERPVAVVEVEDVWSVVAEEDVRIAVVVDVADDDPVAKPREPEPRRLGHVPELVAAQVLEQPVRALSGPSRREQRARWRSRRRACRRCRSRRRRRRSRGRWGSTCPQSCPEKWTKSMPALLAISAKRNGLGSVCSDSTSDSIYIVVRTAAHDHGLDGEGRSPNSEPLWSDRSRLTGPNPCPCRSGRSRPSRSPRRPQPQPRSYSRNRGPLARLPHEVVLRSRKATPILSRSNHPAYSTSGFLGPIQLPQDLASTLRFPEGLSFALAWSCANELRMSNQRLAVEDAKPGSGLGAGSPSRRRYPASAARP